MTYSHTQHAPLYLLILAPMAALLATTAVVKWDPAALVGIGVVAALLVMISFAFQNLTVEDEGDRLRVRFGPVPLFQRTVQYDQVTRATPARSSLIDGWGIHWAPGRGWTWNLWGFDCVEVVHRGRLLRIGTDDPQGLAEFLRSKVSPHS